MGQSNHTTTEGKWKQISEKDRYQIEALLKAKKRPSEIAAQLGFSPRSIQREIAMGKVQQMTTEWLFEQRYCADTAQMRHDERASRKGRGLKIGKCHALAERLEELIVRQRYSPDAALAVIRRENGGEGGLICTRTLYHYLDMSLFAGIELTHLPRKRESKPHQHKHRKVALNNTKGRSIEQRAASVLERREQGHWELDTVVGKVGTKACLLVMTERATNTELVFKLAGKEQRYVVAALDKLERKLGAKAFRTVFQTITCDNGGENLDMEGMEQSLFSKKKRTTLYYAHPYSAYERGSNEVGNCLIRRFVPKGSDIGQLTQRQVMRITHWMNHYPRRKLGYRSSYECCNFSRVLFAGCDN